MSRFIGQRRVWKLGAVLAALLMFGAACSDSGLGEAPTDLAFADTEESTETDTATDGDAAAGTDADAAVASDGAEAATDGADAGAAGGEDVAVQTTDLDPGIGVTCIPGGIEVTTATGDISKVVLLVGNTEILFENLTGRIFSTDTPGVSTVWVESGTFGQRIDIGCDQIPPEALGGVPVIPGPPIPPESQLTESGATALCRGDGIEVWTTANELRGVVLNIEGEAVRFDNLGGNYWFTQAPGVGGIIVESGLNPADGTPAFVDRFDCQPAPEEQ